jgi:predicted dehydrogenase
MMSPANVNVALAGIAGYGDLYLESLLAKGEAAGTTFVGVVEPSPQRSPRLDELRRRGIKVHPTIDSLFAATGVDLMMIATPIHLHAPQACFALERGANVLCEKPLAGTLEDAARMWQAQVTSGRFAAIGFQWSFSAAIHSLKADILAGVLGKPRRLKSIVSFPRSQAYFRRNDWAGRIRTASGAAVSDSPVNNAASHYLHNMLYVLGATPNTTAAPVRVRAELYRANAIENYDTAAVRCEMSGGVEVFFYATHAAAERIGPTSSYEFEKAVVEFDTSGEYAGQFVARFNDGAVKSYGFPNLDRNEKIWQCVDAVRTGKPVACDVQAAFPHALCVAAAQNSSPIIDIPQHLKLMATLEAGPMIAVDGMGDALRDCYATGTLPSDSGRLDWPRGSATVDVEAWARTSDRLPVAL